MTNTQTHNDSNHNDSLLRFMTCGSVDDGKSTLIGRLLLYDTKTILADTLTQISNTSKETRYGGG